MDIRSIILEIGKELNLPNLELNDKGTCSILIDEKMKVDIESDETGDIVRLVGVISPISEVSSAEVFQSLLMANFSEIEGDNNFAIDENTLELVLFSRLKMKYVDAAEFYFRLEDFVNDYEIWVKKFENSEVVSVADFKQPVENTYNDNSAFLRI